MVVDKEVNNFSVQAYVDNSFNVSPARELGPKGIRVNAFVFLTSDEASYITGVVLSVDGMARS